jgi:hypothetical protein
MPFLGFFYRFVTLFGALRPFLAYLWTLFISKIDRKGQINDKKALKAGK